MTREERLAKKRLAERMRYQRIKNDPAMYAIQQDKERMKYEKKKQKGTIKSYERSRAEKRKARTLWKEKTRRHKRRLDNEREPVVITDEYEIFTTERGKTALMYRRYSFSRQGDSQNFYCVKKNYGCRARVKLDGQGAIMYTVSEHNHDPPTYMKLACGMYVKV